MSNTPPEKPEPPVPPKEPAPPKPSGLELTTDEANMLMAGLDARLKAGGLGLESAPQIIELAMKVQNYRDSSKEVWRDPDLEGKPIEK